MEWNSPEDKIRSGNYFGSLSFSLVPSSSHLLFSSQFQQNWGTVPTVWGTLLIALMSNRVWKRNFESVLYASVKWMGQLLQHFVSNYAGHSWQLMRSCLTQENLFSIQHHWKADVSAPVVRCRSKRWRPHNIATHGAKAIQKSNLS